MTFVGFLAIFLLPILLGCYAAKPFHSFQGLFGILAAGSVTGLTLFTVITYGVSATQGLLDWKSIIIALSLFVLVTFGLHALAPSIEASHYISLEENRRTSWLTRGILIFCSLLVIFCVDGSSFVRNGNLYSGMYYNTGDLQFHLHFTTRFFHSFGFIVSNPIYEGVPLRYHFLSDFYSSIFWFATGKMEWSLKAPAYALTLSMINLLFQWSKRLTASSLAGALTVLLFLLLGEMDWLYVARRALQFLSVPIQSGVSHNLYWLNLLHAYLGNQRSMLFAFPLFLLLLSITLDAARHKDWKRFLFVATVGLGTPFIQVHLSMVLLIFAGVLFLQYASKAWLVLVIFLALLWAPQLFYLSGMIGPSVVGANHAPLRLIPGWKVHGWLSLPYWLRCTGAFIPLSIWGLYYERKRFPELGLFSTAAFLVFLLGNFVVFQISEKDNEKILVFWYLGGLPMVALMLVHLLKARGLWPRILSLTMIFYMTFPGFLEFTSSIWPERENNLIASREDLLAAAWIRTNIPDGGVFLGAPVDNPIPFLTGHPVVMGCNLVVTAHGLPTDERTNDILAIYEGRSDAQKLLQRYHITHAFYGTRERQAGFSSIYLETHGQMVYHNGDLAIYEL